MKHILKKYKGAAGVMDFLPVILIIVCGTYLLINCGLYIKYLDILNKLENLSRKYVLIMETTNGLTTGDLDNFYNELEELGIPASDADFEGTTFWDGNIEYGEEIYLNLKVKIPYYRITIRNDFSKIKDLSKKEVSIHKCALALA